MDTETTPTRTQVLQHELAAVRWELRRIDAKARELLVVATFAVTVTAIMCGTPHTSPPPVVAAGFVLAALPWAGAVIQLTLAIRPMLIRDDVPIGASTMDTLLTQRWRILNRIVTSKYAMVRRAVDLLLAMFAISAASGLLWLLL